MSERQGAGEDRARRVLGSILEAVGRTPLVELSRVGPGPRARVLAKVEGLNPSGSIKVRSALAMIEAAEREGRLGPDSIIVEPTSGNQGIALAMVAAVKGYRARLVMPETMSAERRALITAYGAEVVLTPAGRDIREAIELCIQEARRQAAEDPRVFLPQQFENPANPAAHRATTGPEILEQAGGQVDAFVAGVGTGGTLTGVGEALKAAWPQAKVIAVEPANAALLSGGRMGQHIQQGIGDGLIPDVLNLRLIDRIITVEDDDAAATARELARREGLLAGASSGANVWASLQVAREMGPGHTVVTVLPDTGERYLSLGLF